MYRLKLPLSTGKVANFSARHPWWVIGVWLVLLVLAGVAAPGLKTGLTGGEMRLLNNPDSVQGQTLLKQKMAGDPTASLGATETVVVHSDAATVDDPQFQQVVQQTTTSLAGKTGLVAQAYDYYQAALFDADAAGALISGDRHTALIVVNLAGTSSQVDDNMEQYLALIKAQGVKGYTIATVGESSIGHEFSSTAENDLKKAELVGLPLTLIVLVLVFGAVLAAGVSLALALVAIFVSVGVISVIGVFVPQSFFIVNMIMMIGLAVGIDYALFIVERYREERRQGLGKIEAITATGATASRAVLFSGGTVILALLGLFLVPITTFRSLGLGALVVVSAAVLAVLTLVPALLSVLGDRVNWPLVRWHRKKHTGERVHSSRTVYKGIWGKFTKGVMARPVVGVALTVVILLAIAAPSLMLKTGAAASPDALPPGDRRTAYELLAENFPPGLLSPVQIVVSGKETPELDQAIKTLQDGLRRSKDFAGSSIVTWNQAKDLALITAPLSIPTDSPEAYQAIRDLRGDLIPSTFAHLDASVHATGQTALDADSVDLVNKFTPAVLAFVLGLTFILLMIVFRSIVVPLNAIIMNLLSVGAAYGMLVLVFQKGIGHRLFGFQQTPTIEAWVPIFLFCILFGLSMDYHVFLLSRIREHYDRTDKSREAVAVGLKATSRIITGAALIMVVVFSTFAAGNLVMLQQVGFGLAVAVLLDATLIRSILVPATMAILGKISWYLPRALKKVLPRVSLEGGRTKPIRPPA
ncbi:MAG: MMPL family transporter [Actinobacteria bacterium]|nr:MMPL family transporter [Actinomycetota bacterium]